MRASGQRLCQMVHDAGLRPGNEEHLQVVLLEATRARGRLDDSFVSLFDEVLVGFLDKFTIVKKLVDDFDISSSRRAQALRCPPPSTATMVTTSSTHWSPCDCPPSRRRMSTSRSRSPHSA